MIIYHGGCKLDRMPEFADEDFPFNIHTLQSFAYDNKKIHRKYKYIAGVFCDCGAFSAWTIGKEINLQDYINFVHKYKDELHVYAALDSIGDPKKSWDNYKEMVKQGLDPLPALHYGEDFVWLERYVKKTNYIALGGLPKNNKKRTEFFNRVFSIHPNPKEIGFHGFGVTGFDLLRRYPWKSVDSISATIAGGMGRIVTPWGSFSVSEKSSNQKIFSKKVEQYLKDHCNTMNIKWEDLFDGKNIGHVARMRLNVFTLEKIGRECPKTFNSDVDYLL